RVKIRDILQDLENRGLIHQTTDFEGLEQHLANNQVTLYCGFDQTADSLHIEHLLTIKMLKRYQQADHSPIAFIGGGKGVMGDPSCRTSERTLNEENVVHGFAESIRNQLAGILNFEAKENAAVARNNHDWLSKLTIIDFLRDAGKHFTVNYMLA